MLRALFSADVFPKDVSSDAIRHFLGRRHHQHYLTRIFSAFVFSVLVWLSQGQTIGIIALIWVAGITVLEVKAFLETQPFLGLVEAENQAQNDEIMAKLFVMISVIAAAYSLPVIGLAFTDQSGKTMGLILAASILMNAAGQHVIHPRLILFSLPFPALAFFMSAVALAGTHMWIVIFVALVFILQTALLTIAATHSSQALIASRKEAEVEALARGKADAANQTKSNFLANMSHELRTPLNAVIGYGEILKENAEFENRPNDVADIDKVLTSANRLLRLVGDILDGSKIEAGAMRLERTSFDVRAELQTALDMVQPQASSNGNQLITEFSADLGTAVSDPLRFSQCVLNLLSNAAKFTKDGQIKLEASRLKSASGDSVKIVVADTGIGISEEQQKLLFKPFAQADDSVTKKYGGTGLGLSLTQSLARLMGGEVTLNSQEGKGSSFELTIPVTLPEPQQAA
jgi:signal transduction histidine kinase